MNFQDLIKKGDIRKAEIDRNLAKSILNTSKNDLLFFNNLKINKNSARKIVSNYYDILRSILEAISTLDGYKIYSHEAFTYFLKEKHEEVLSIKFDRFRKIRNKINYYGKSIEVKEAEEIVRGIKSMISILINRYLKEL